MPAHGQPPTAAELGLMVGSRPAPDRLVTLANWQEPPFNRWAFQHFRELVPTARIARGDGPVAELPRAPRDLGRLRFASVDGGRTTLTGMLRATYTDAFLVLHRGAVVMERYFNGMEPATLHLLQSVSKSLTGTVAGILIARGVLDPHRPVTDYVSDLAGTSFAGATLRQVLDMRTGTKFSEEYTDLRAEIRQYEQVIGWRPLTDPQPADDLWSYIGTLDNAGPHGGPFEYRSILTDLLGWILESATGTRYAELMSRELWSRLGVEHDAEIALDPHGHPVADGGISVTLRDLARFGQAYLQGGRFNGARIVPATWVRDCWQGDDDTRAAFAPSPAAARHPNGMYRNQWWVRDTRNGVLLASGIHGQSVYVSLPTETVIVKLSTWPEALDLRFAGEHVRAFEAVAAALQRQASAAPRRPTSRK
jgi:CubicO group peptidase (beta-lactamase class C family)